MEILQPLALESPGPCPYLPGREKRYEYFLARELDGEEIAGLLAEGWRKFGIYFFRPACPDCRQCIPLRVDAAAFQPSRSQRRLLRRGTQLVARFRAPTPVPELYRIYCAHAAARFDLPADYEEFLLLFYLPSCPGLQSEFYLGQELVAAGFLDLGHDCLSSVYFCFDPEQSRFRPGILGALVEIEQAKKQGLRWYYLGYYVPGSPRMGYKDHFRPRQHYDWQLRQWRTIMAPPASPEGDVTG